MVPENISYLGVVQMVEQSLMTQTLFPMLI